MCNPLQILQLRKSFITSVLFSKTRLPRAQNGAKEENRDCVALIGLLISIIEGNINMLSHIVLEATCKLIFAGN